MARALLTIALVLAAAAAAAHHSIAGAYDRNKPVTVEGTVTQFRFVNPHPSLSIEVRDAAGNVAPWFLEMDSRGELAAVGFSAETFKAGDQVEVTGSASRTQATAMYIQKLRRAGDGFAYEQVGSSPRITSNPGARR
ncbi:MAG: DUF6152 family protein [Vicinamibacterales bacterium]